MIKRIATLALRIFAPVAIFIGANLYDPYLLTIRGRGYAPLATVELAVIGVLICCWSPMTASSSTASIIAR